MPLLDLRRARAEIRLTDVLHLVRFVPTEQKGQQVRGPCPVHHSSPGSRVFSGNLSRGIWQCFKCRAAGNALDLYMACSGLPLYEAVFDLYLLLRRDPPWLATDEPPRNRKRNP